MKQPTFEQMKEFLVKRYKHSRLYGDPGDYGPGVVHGDCVVRSTLEYITKYSAGCAASQYESATGEAVWCQIVDGEIREVDADTALLAMKKPLESQAA